jgi:hypothetical protein
VKIRKHIYLEPRQEQELKRAAKKAGVSESQIIRDALDRRFGHNETQHFRREAWRAEEAFIRQRMSSAPKPGSPRKWNRNEILRRVVPG